MSGIISGAGHQLGGTAINFIAFYVVGLPIGISLALATNLKSFGMWIGLLCASITQVIGYSIALLLLDWKKKSELAMKRASAYTEDQREDKVYGTESIASKEYQPVNREDDEDVVSTEVTDELLAGEDTVSEEEDQTRSTSRVGYCLKLLVTKGSFCLIGVIGFVAAGMASLYHPPDFLINGNYSECTVYNSSI